MVDSRSVSEPGVPSSPQSFKISKAALGLVLTAFLLIGLLVYSTIQNINQASEVSQKFLVQKGEMIIRSIEAGTRSMMHYMREGNPLETLITENSRDDDVTFIRITDRLGVVLAETGDGDKIHLSSLEIAEILGNDSRLMGIIPDSGVFSLSRKFRLTSNFRRHGMMRRRGLGERFHWDEMIVSVGLLTTEFDLVRQQDVRQKLFMVAILFLVGCAGFYFLFLYQGMRVAKVTLANMKLYTDNVIKCIPAGLVTLGAEDRVVSCNHRAEQISGLPFTTMRGMRFQEAFSGISLSSSEICRDSLEHTVKCVSPHGRKIPVTLSGSTLMDHDGQNIGTVIILRDMSLMFEMEQQLERSRRMAALGKMAAGIAHEIRNPLGTLRGFAQYFGRKSGEDQESKEYSDLMVSEVDRLNQNVSGLLQFARPREPQLADVEIDEILEKTEVLMGGDFKSHNVHFHWQRNSNMVVRVDPDLFLQVLLNLLKNSISATDAGGEISVEVKKDRDQVRLLVKDNGCGMTEEEQERMFDPFFTTKKAGTGLGLAVSHQIIQQHGGNIEVNSSPGLGSEVIIVFPDILH